MLWFDPSDAVPTASAGALRSRAGRGWGTFTLARMNGPRRRTGGVNTGSAVFDCASASPRLVAVQDPFAKLVEKAAGFELEAADILAAGEQVVI